MGHDLLQEKIGTVQETNYCVLVCPLGCLWRYLIWICDLKCCHALNISFLSLNLVWLLQQANMQPVCHTVSDTLFYIHSHSLLHLDAVTWPIKVRSVQRRLRESGWPHTAEIWGLGVWGAVGSGFLCSLSVYAIFDSLPLKHCCSSYVSQRRHFTHKHRPA